MANGNGAGLFKGPAGLGSGIAGPQGMRRQYGLPQVQLPGYTNAREAAIHRLPTGGSAPEMPQVDYATACAAAYLTRILCDCLGEVLVNIQTVARRPSHIDVPYSGVCFDRHIGSGPVGSPDPPIVLPVAAGFIEILTFVVPDGHNGVVKCFGVDVTPAPSAPGIEWIVLVDNQRVAPFDTGFGSIAATGGTWFGPPGTLESPQELCVNLFPKQVVTLAAQNLFGAGPVTVAARMCGWVYPPTIQTDDRTIRGTLTDQR